MTGKQYRPPKTDMQSKAIIIMGVSGCGKSTVGGALAQELGSLFFDADDYHPPENVAKMSAGHPLNDEDRVPWLEILHDLINLHIRTGRPMVLACSALKQQYRDQLLDGNPGTKIVYLQGTFELISGRMQAREGHYMRPDMLKSQFEALEEPTQADATIISIELPVKTQVLQIKQELG